MAYHRKFTGSGINTMGFFAYIPSLDTPLYSSMRNRVCEDVSEWLQPEMRAFLSGKLKENNTKFIEKEQKAVNRKMEVESAVNIVALGTFRWVRQHTPKESRVKIVNKIKKY